LAAKVGIHLENFNNRVKVMNQTNAKDLTLSAKDARNMQASIFDLLTKIADLTEIQEKRVEDEVVNVSMDGGTF
jgi:hypothetical protein